MQNLYVVTHAQATHHIDGLLGGWYDSSLTEKGISQARKLGEFLFEQIQVPGIPVYSSDLKRAFQTAREIAGHFDSTIMTDTRLREFNIGEGTGKPSDWINSHYIPVPVHGNRLDHQICPGCETRRELGTRISDCINEIIATGDENIIIVSHGHALTFIIMAWLQVPIEYMGSCRFRTAPASVTRLQEDDHYHERIIVYLSKDIP